MVNILSMVILSVISGLVGGCIGGLVAWGGIKVRLEHLEKKMERLSDTVVYNDVCEVVRAANAENHKEVMDALKDLRKQISDGR